MPQPPNADPLIGDREPDPERFIRVLIVEDHRMFSQALSAALDEADDIAVTSAVSTAAEGLRAAAETNPDVVLMDYRLPDGNGVEAAGQIKAAHPEVRIVMLTASSDESVL